MSTRKVVRRRLKQYATGDLDARIKLVKRELKSPTFQSSKPRIQYTLIKEVWASVKTLTLGEIVFNEVKIKGKSNNNSTAAGAPSHLFVIRFRENVTSETRIEWRNNYYEIIKTINPEERNEYLELYSILAGTKELEANE